jgi:PAS domain S-box-containing protein
VGRIFSQFAADEADAPVEMESLVLRGDGAERLIQWRNTTLRDEAGRFLATISSGADVTELRAAEAELRASEERNRLIVETARDYAILTTDLEGRITSWSPGAEAVFGHAPEDVLGRDVALLFTPEDREAREAARERDAARRQGSAADNRCYVRRDGERFWLEGAAWPLHDSAGRETGILKVGRDDTARRKTDLLMRDAVDRQAFLTREVGHRIKNNLAIVASLLSLQARNAGSEETRTALDDARGRIDAIAQVHDQLWRQNQSETIDLDDFLRDLCARVQQAVPHHRIDYAGADGPVTIAIERAVTLSLVVNELVTNAAKYAYPSGEGGPIVVSLGRLEPEVLRLEVADRGIGFAEGAAHGGSGDAGFGTRMLRTLTRQLGATLEVTGDEGGTRVTLIIPPMAA